MPIWREDVIEQICIACILRDGKTTSGCRLSMILVDNAVEFIIKVYGEKLVHDKRLSRDNWDDTKRHFERLVNVVLPKTQAVSYKEQILEYHRVRNDLYHGTNPLSVAPDKINCYVAIAQELLKRIFDFAMSEEEWNQRAESIQGILLPKAEKTELVSFFNTEDGFVRMQTNKTPKDTDAILLMIYGITQKTGKSPENTKQLQTCLNLSGHSIESERLTVNISHLRTQGKISKGRLTLTTKGRDYVKKKYFVPL
jgi:hypothetical protein